MATDLTGAWNFFIWPYTRTVSFGSQDYIPVGVLTGTVNMTVDATSNNLTFTILIHDGSAGQGGMPEIVFSDGVVSSFPQYQGPGCVAGGSPFMILTMTVTYMTLGVPNGDPSSSLFLLTDAGDLVGLGVDSQVDSQVILTRPSSTS